MFIHQMFYALNNVHKLELGIKSDSLYNAVIVNAAVL